ncbi:MAG: MFS transporter [Lentisphaeria bacterium]|nr:MFS transporter [Lentisphaeria bacterium]
MTLPQAAWLVYDLANAAHALIVRTVFAPLCIKVCAEGVASSGDATSYWGLVASVSGIAAGVLSVLLGKFCDSRGCRKKLLMFFVFTGVLSTWGFAFCSQGDFYSVLMIAFVSLGCYLCANSLYDSLLLDVASPEQRDKMSVTGYALGYIGGVVPFIVCLVLAYLMDDKAAAMRIAFFIAGAWWLLLSLPLFFLVREERRPSDDRSFIDSAKEVWYNSNVRYFLVAYFLYIDGVGTIYLMATPIAVDIGISQTALLATILGLQFYAFPCTLLYGKFARKFGSVKMINFAIACYVFASLLVGFMPFIGSKAVKLAIFIALAVIIGSSQGGIQSLSRSFYSRIIPAEKSAEYYGFYNFFGKFTTVVGPLLVFITVRLTGYSEFGIMLLVLPFICGGVLLNKVAKQLG